MKKVVILLFVGLVALFSCNKEDDAVSSDIQSHGTRLKSAESDWNSLTQTQKDDKIINRAYVDNGVYVGLECKPWVSKVVYDATAGYVILPSTLPNYYEWGSASHVVRRYLTIRNVDRGDIIQMKFLSTGGPHTAIVVSKNSTGMTWIQSNVRPPYGKTVSVDPMSFTIFDSKFGTQYSVYRVY